MFVAKYMTLFVCCCSAMAVIAPDHANTNITSILREVGFDLPTLPLKKQVVTYFVVLENPKNTIAVVPQSEIARLVTTTSLFQNSSSQSVLLVHTDRQTSKKFTILTPHYCLVLCNSYVTSYTDSLNFNIIIQLTCMLQNVLSDEAFALCCYDAGLLHYADKLLTKEEKRAIQCLLLRLLMCEKRRIRDLLHDPRTIN